MITETKASKYEALTCTMLDIRRGGWPKIFMPSNFSILSSSSTACGPVFDSLSGGDSPVSARFFEPLDPRNGGVLSDEIALSSSGARVRRISFVDAVSGVVYVFVTNEMTLPPGVLAELARRRWAIEKVFDQLKKEDG